MEKNGERRIVERELQIMTMALFCVHVQLSSGMVAMIIVGVGMPHSFVARDMDLEDEFFVNLRQNIIKLHQRERHIADVPSYIPIRKLKEDNKEDIHNFSL